MATGATGQLGLALPVQGELSGTWGDTVNNGITQYTNIAIAATLTLTNDGAVTLANTTGDATASNIVSSLTGAGTVTAQFAIVRVTGTLTTAKVVTAPSYSKTYTVVNAATGGIVTFKASGQTGVSIAVGESAFVYYNGTDYVKVSGTSAVSSFTAGTTGFTPNTATTGAVTLAGTLATTNGGTGLTSFTSGGVVYASSSSALATGSVLTFDGTKLSVGSGASTSAGLISGYFGASGYGAIWSTGVTPSTSNFAFLTNGTSTGLNGSSNVFIQANNTDVVNINTVGVLINTATNVNNAKLKSKVTGGGIGLEITDEATSDFVVVPAVSSGVCKIGPTAGTMAFQQAGTEGMRLTSTGLGIGTSSPAYKLDLYTTAQFSGRWGNATRAGHFYADSGGPGIFNTAAYGGEGMYFHAGSNYIQFITNSNENMRLDSAGGLKTKNTIGVGDATPSTSGAGITFPATQSASSNANTLDDYEEGTWTPTITFGGASVGVTYNTTFTGATYTKIGNRVCVSGYLEVTNKGSSTGDASIGNLPFTSESGATKYLGATVGGSSFTFANQFWARIAAASTTIDLLETTEAGAQSFITNSDCTNGTNIYFSATYTV